MTQKSVTWSDAGDATIAEKDGGTSLGAGYDDHLPVGRISGGGGFTLRSVLKFNVTWPADMVRLVKAELKMRTSSGYHASIGSNPSFEVRRLTETFTPGTEGADEDWHFDNAVEWSNQPSSTGTNAKTYSGLNQGEYNGTKTAVIDITAMIEDILPATKQKRNGSPGPGGTFRGVKLISTDEGNTARYAEFRSQNYGSTDPEIVITYETNRAPGAPLNVTPADGSVYASSTGTTIVVAGTFNDPDDANYILQTAVEVYPAGTLQAQIDAGTATLLQTTTQTPGGQPQTFSVTVPALSKRTTYVLRVRNSDQDGDWGAWSPLFSVTTNATPGAPSNPTVEAGTLTPIFQGSISSPDPGAYISAAEVEVLEDPAGSGSVTKWDSGDQAIGGTSTRFSLQFGSGGYTDPVGLEFGHTYRFRMRLADDAGVWGPFGAWVYWTPLQATGPSNMTPRNTDTKQNTLTPTLTINNGANFDRWKLTVWDNPDALGTPVWTVPEQTIASTATRAGAYGDNTGLTGASTATPLVQGGTYYWTAAIRLTGNPTIGPDSPLYPFKINSLPAAPLLTVSV